MKTLLAALCVAFLTVFALSACGGDAANNTASNSPESNKTEQEPEKPKTPAEERQAVVDRMKAAAEAMDADALKGLFLEDEHENAEKRIGVDWRGSKDAGIKQTVTASKIEEKDGKFIAHWTIKIEKDGTVEEESPFLMMIEKDGKWYLSFKR
jgi:hypothetical protein